MSKKTYEADFTKYTPVQLKKYSKICYITGVITLFLSIFTMPIGILLLLFGLFLIFIGFGFSQTLKEQNKTSSEQNDLNISSLPQAKEVELDNIKNENGVDESSKNYCFFEDIEQNENEEKQILFYEYEKNICFIDYDINNLSGNGGEDVSFVQEPDNQYDNKAIAIYLDNTKIGYVYKGQTQDMINDWIKKNMYFRGYINKIYLKENKATFKIAFYKPLDAFENKTFSLIKTKKKIDEFSRRDENLECCSEGETVQLEYEDCFYNDKETLTVSNDCYEEIGELGNGAIKYYNDHSDEKIVGIIDELFYDDNDNIKAKIKLFATRKVM